MQTLYSPLGYERETVLNPRGHGGRLRSPCQAHLRCTRDKKLEGDACLNPEVTILNFKLSTLIAEAHQVHIPHVQDSSQLRLKDTRQDFPMRRLLSSKPLQP